MEMITSHCPRPSIDRVGFCTLPDGIIHFPYRYFDLEYRFNLMNDLSGLSHRCVVIYMYKQVVLHNVFWWCHQYGAGCLYPLMMMSL